MEKTDKTEQTEKHQGAGTSLTVMKGWSGSRLSFTASHKDIMTKPDSAGITVRPADEDEAGRIIFRVIKSRSGTYSIQAFAKDDLQESVHMYPEAAAAAVMKRIRRRDKVQRHMLNDDNLLEKETIENRKKELLSVMKAF